MLPTEIRANSPYHKKSWGTYALKQAIVLAMCLVILNEMLGGVIKYYTANSALLYLSYIPIVFAGVVVIGYFVIYGLTMHIHKQMGLFLLLFMSYSIYGLFMGRELGAVAFGLYIWLPFFLGLLVSSFELQGHFQKNILIWWLIVTTGVLINAFVVFPWTGESYQIFGQTMQTSRDWTTAGFNRLAGFSRANYAASNQIALFCVVVLTMRMNIFLKIVIWLMSTVAIYLTTSKTTLIAMAVVPLMIILVEFLQQQDYAKKKPTKNAERVALAVLTGLASVSVLLPVLFLTSRSQITSSEGIGFINLSSMMDRGAWMWPNAWDLIFKTDEVFPMIFGRGIGGIGTPQYFFERLNANSADNLFIYLYVTFGAFSIFFIRFLVMGVRKWLPINSSEFLVYYTLTCVVFIVGMTSNVIESASMCLIIGILIGKSAPAKWRNKNEFA
ncbi:MAG: hypothetical protein SFW65_01395 [Alphaproteobacteria bacterium]|nr:hypothetical protein [Alphaproteobacteria bacterium]